MDVACVHDVAYSAPGQSVGSVSARALVAGLLGWAWRQASAERERWILWLPVLFGCGIGAAFGLDQLPSRATGHAALLAGICLLVVAANRAARRRPGQVATAMALAAMTAGFGAAIERTYTVAAPVLQRPGSYDVSGRVVQIEEVARGLRVTMDPATLEGPAGRSEFHGIRISVHRGLRLTPGERIAIRARLQPPMGPALPGGFDFARQAWFSQLSALGFALGAPRQVAPSEAEWSLAIAELRARLADRITDVAPGEAGAVAAALLTGVRAGFSDDLWRDFQISGLAHILSISGLHMVLVAGVVLGTVRYALALVPALALRLQARKIAAVLALLATAFYTLLAGAPVPAQRSFLMIAVALLGVVVAREPVSMRLLAWSALGVLGWHPEALLGASFQLSFAAVGALIAVYESPAVRDRLRAGRDESVPRRMLVYVQGIAATTLIASTATAPLGAFHFQTVPTYGVLANLIAVPVTTFWVMPAGLVSLLAMPIGLDSWTIPLMIRGIDVVLATARVIAGLPGASLTVGLLPTATLSLFGLGMAWLCLWRRRWRWFGLAPVVASLGIAIMHRPPDLLVTPDLAMMAAPLRDGRIALVQWRGNGLVRDSWQRALGGGELIRVGPDTVLQDGLACDRSGCVLQRAGQSVALARRADATVEDCALASLLIALDGDCDGPAQLIDRWTLRGSQGLAVRFHEQGLEIETVAAARGGWPWSSRRESPIASSGGEAKADGGGRDAREPGGRPGIGSISR